MQNSETNVETLQLFSHLKTNYMQREGIMPKRLHSYREKGPNDSFVALC